MFASHCSAASLSLCAAGFKAVLRRSGRKRPYRFDGCGDERMHASGDLRRNDRSFFFSDPRRLREILMESAYI
jgi:hypothetical protein